MINVNSRIKLKKDTLANWNSHPDYVLYNGEVAIVLFPDGTYAIKVGNGETVFSELDYILFASISSKKLDIGDLNVNSGTGSTTIGDHLSNSGQYSVVTGTSAQTNENWTFVWNGDPTKLNDKYSSHGNGTFNINPKDGIDGIYIGGTKLVDIVVQQNHTGNFSINGNMYVKGIGDYDGGSTENKQDLATIIKSVTQRIGTLESRVNTIAPKVTTLESQLEGLETAIHIINNGSGSSSDHGSTEIPDLPDGYELIDLNPIYCDSNGNPSEWSYETPETNHIKYCIQNHAINRIILSSNDYPVVIELPEIEDGYARDYIIRLEIVMNGDIPQITFESKNENITFESTDDWQDIVKGVNIISFTETYRNV